MARKRAPGPGQLPLEGVVSGGRRKVGTVERAVQNDVRLLRAMELLPPAVETIAHAFRLIAREFDRCELEGDRWGKLAAARELRALREQVGSLSPLPIDDDFDNAVERLAATLRDTPPT